MENAAKQPINRRSLTAMFLFFSFILLPVSGVPLHFSRTEADPGITEHFLMSVHNMSALLFFMAALTHVTFNWNALTKYLAKKTTEHFQFRKEMMIALLMVILIVGLYIGFINPS